MEVLRVYQMHLYPMCLLLYPSLSHPSCLLLEREENVQLMRYIYIILKICVKIFLLQVVLQGMLICWLNCVIFRSHTFIISPIVSLRGNNLLYHLFIYVSITLLYWLFKQVTMCLKKSTFFLLLLVNIWQTWNMNFRVKAFFVICINTLSNFIYKYVLVTPVCPY